MERVMSMEDKIKRAEEIYYRRRNQEVPSREEVIRENIKKSSRERKEQKILKKMIKQIIICLIIYGIFYVIVNSNYIFSEDFCNKAKEILSTDINIFEIFSNISEKVSGVVNNLQQIMKEPNEELKEEINEEQQNTEQQNGEENQQNIQENDENIGGAEELTNNSEGETQKSDDVEKETNQENTQEGASQMEQDANYIKETISFIKPVAGSISSKFGLRNPTTSTVPKNHTGTDIAATTGTKIVSATDGEVILYSTQGDFGNHIQVQINDVIIVYAHCDKIYVKEGDKLIQGQEIAEVGSTGNTTGPHLHFEIRYQGRYVDPEMILEL